MRASSLTEHVPGERDAIGRLRVDEFLEVVGVPGVYAAGDTAAAVAEPGHVVMQSCQHAVPRASSSASTSRRTCWVDRGSRSRPTRT
jgi:NADH dehydrogenase